RRRMRCLRAIGCCGHASIRVQRMRFSRSLRTKITGRPLSLWHFALAPHPVFRVTTRLLHPLMSSNPTPVAMRRFAAALLAAGAAVANAQSGLVARSTAEDQGIKPEASFSERIDPWSRWTLRLHADPALGNATAARADVDVRFLTERLDGHQLQAGAAMSLSPTATEPVVQAWQPFEGDAPSLF